MIQRLFSVCFCLVFLSACTSKYYRKSADKEVAKIISQKTPLVPNMDPHFTIEATNQLSLTNLVVFDKSEEAFGKESEMEKGAKILTLKEALDVAVKHSNEYQTRKEKLYIQAMDLTAARHDYTPIFKGEVSVVETISHNQPNENVDRIVEKSQVQVEGSYSFSWALATGAKLSSEFTSQFVRVFGGEPPGFGNALTANLTQPLLKGAGYTVAMENLTQAERDMLYNLREFTRYRKDFTVEIASDYYQVLQNRDAVRNNWRGLQNYKQNVARERAYFDEGERSQASLDQLKQAELQTESDWISSVRSYRQSLDKFKVRIGLSSDARVILDDRELEQLKIVPTPLSIEQAENVAIVSRLDLDTTRDMLADAARHVKVAANSLLPELGLDANVTVPTTVGTTFPAPDWQRYGWTSGVTLGLPLDRLKERNNYRANLIYLDQAKRNFYLAIDNMKVQIADDWRNLDQAERTYQIRDWGVQIATRRVEEQELRQELGRGTSRDLVDAQSDLINSKNQRTAALINHTIARLGFYRDMGVLWIKDNGQWDENPPKTASVKNETKNP